MKYEVEVAIKHSQHGYTGRKFLDIEAPDAVVAADNAAQAKLPTGYSSYSITDVLSVREA